MIKCDTAFGDHQLKRVAVTVFVTWILGPSRDSIRLCHRFPA